MQPKEVAKQKCNPIWLHFYFLWIPVEKCHHNESLAHIYVETIRYEVQIEAILPKDQPVASNRGNTKLALKCLAQIFPHFGRKIGESYESVSQYSLRKNSQVAHPDKFDRYGNWIVSHEIGMMQPTIRRYFEKMVSNCYPQQRTFPKARKASCSNLL